MTVVLALASAGAFGASVALQHRAAASAPMSEALRLRLLARLARRPVWIAGIVASGAGFVLQAAALRHGSLVVVQPLLTSALVFALVLLALSTRHALSLRELVAVGAVVGGVSALLVTVGVRSSVNVEAGSFAWLASSAVIATTVAVAARYSRHLDARRRALSLGVAAGVANGYVAALTKAFAGDVAKGPSAILHGWAIWALAGAAAPAIILVQTVYQAGHLRLSLPLITVLDPLVAVGLGVVLFHERIPFDAARLIALALAALLAISGLWSLAARSRLSSDAAST